MKETNDLYAFDRPPPLPGRPPAPNNSSSNNNQQQQQLPGVHGMRHAVIRRHQVISQTNFNKTVFDYLLFLVHVRPPTGVYFGHAAAAAAATVQAVSNAGIYHC